jgi:hypothetical protein
MRRCRLAARWILGSNASRSAGKGKLADSR